MGRQTKPLKLLATLLQRMCQSSPKKIRVLQQPETEPFHFVREISFNGWMRMTSCRQIKSHFKWTGQTKPATKDCYSPLHGLTLPIVHNVRGFCRRPFGVTFPLSNGFCERWGKTFTCRQPHGW